MISLSRRTFVALSTMPLVQSTTSGEDIVLSEEADGYGLDGYGESVFGELVEVPGICAYVDTDGVVRTAGLRTAVDDWRSGEVDTGLLRKVVDTWRSREAIAGCE